jgi:dTDP-4-dehydrorhamnose 3,5-epimerase
MTFLEPLPGLFHLRADPHRDARGSFTRLFSKAAFAQHGLCTDFPEWSQSHNTRARTVRGLHWQEPAEVKIVHCAHGAIFDVAVDLRRGSATFGQHYAATLSAENGEGLYIPHGFAHGFQTLADASTVLYHISEPYVAGGARGVRWNDPTLAIPWPDPDTSTLSDRDAALPLLSELSLH